MILSVTERQSHCTTFARRLKQGLVLLAALAATRANAQPSPPEDSPLRAELTQLLENGQTERALARVQRGLRENPDDEEVRQEFIALHLALARKWLSEGRFDDCLAAVRAILTLQPQHELALSMQREILAARETAGDQASDIDRLLRLELFESALQRIREVKTLCPDLENALAARERRAWRGAADDHYLAGNFNEAFALYEHLLSLEAETRPDVISRWSISLALALSESGSGQASSAGAIQQMRARVTKMLPRMSPPLVRHAITGLLAERAGAYLEAGHAYAEGLGVAWRLPPADQRRASVPALGRQIVERLRELHAADREREREGAWQIALPDIWKNRRTKHFDVYARNDLVTERVAEAAEFHLDRLREWLGLADAADWEPRCEVRVHATLEDVHREAETANVTRALTRMRMEGNRVILRRTDVAQDDAWLLSSTLPRELTHLLLTEGQAGAGLPLALEEGLALQAEPPARKLQSRRLLGTTVPNPAGLLSATGVPTDQMIFRGSCDALTNLLLHRAGTAAPDRADGSPIAIVLRGFQNGLAADWWTAFGWESEAAMLEDWAAWYASWRDPARMPLMIVAQQPVRGATESE